MKHLFIINPAAGGRDATAEVEAKVRDTFARRGGEYELYRTRAPMDACAKVQRESERCGALRVYACGGDGTLNECVNGAAERENVAVTHFPTGTGNDFIKTFGRDAALFRDLDALLDGAVCRFDLMDCNGRKSVNICSVGVDARIGLDVHKYSRIPLIGGATGYVTSTAVHLARGVGRPLRVICNGKLYYGDMSLVCCCNGTHYGGGFNPVPEARPDDGLLDILVVKGVSRLRFLSLVGSYARGGYAKHPKYITHVQTDSIKIMSPGEIGINADGELLRGREFFLRLLPQALNFILPAGTAFRPLHPLSGDDIFPMRVV